MKKKKNDKAGGSTDKKHSNAGNGAFDQGGEQDPGYNDETKLSDEEKERGHTTTLGKEKENPKDGNIGTNNAGGYK